MSQQAQNTQQQKQVKSLLEAHNLVMEETDELVKALQKVVKQSVRQVAEKKKQMGGRIVLPSEYFGIESGRYGAQESHQPMNQPTDNVTRPALDAHWEGAPLKSPLLMSGGSARSFVSQKQLKELNQKQGNALLNKELKVAQMVANVQIQSFMNALQKLVKNTERKVGKTHVRQAMNVL